MKIRKYDHPFIAREGWYFITISIAFTLLVMLFAGLLFSLIFILITAFIIQFFRDPQRIIPNDNNLILSPADGKIIAVEETLDPYFNTPVRKISIFMNIFNVHSNRCPVNSEVIDLNYFPGKFINADFDKASTDNERNIMVLKLENNRKITVVQVAGLIARRILCYVKIQQKLTKGQRFGFIRFGSRVDIYIPLDFETLVSIGQKVYATESVIARFIDEPNK